MFSVEEADSWIARTAHDSSGEQIGVISQIWVDDESGRPEWASVTLAFGGREALVPLAGTIPLGGGRQFAYSKEEIVDAPHVADDGHLSVKEKEEISLYYGPPATVPAAREESWVDRLEDAAQLTPQRGAAPPEAAAPSNGSAEKPKRRYGRKPAPAHEEAKRRFGRKPAPAPERARRRFRRTSAESAQPTESA